MGESVYLLLIYLYLLDNNIIYKFDNSGTIKKPASYKQFFSA